MTYIFKKIIIPVLAAGCCIFSCKSVPSSVYEGTYLDADNNEPNLVITTREDGQWLIDDFICLDEPVYDWKQHMEEYLKTELL